MLEHDKIKNKITKTAGLFCKNIKQKSQQNKSFSILKKIKQKKCTKKYITLGAFLDLFSYFFSCSESP